MYVQMFCVSTMLVPWMYCCKEDSTPNPSQKPFKVSTSLHIINFDDAMDTV